MSRCKLTYFNVRALGEPIRYMLAYSGVDFQDVRVGEEWPQLKLNTPFGKLPTIELDGEVFHQSAAICRYLAAGTDLAGGGPKEDLRIDQAVGAFNDLTGEVGRMFNTTEPGLQERLKRSLLEEGLPFYFRRFDRLILDNGGYLANSKLSWADLYVVAYSESLPVIFQPSDPTSGYPNIQRLRTTVRALKGVDQWLRTRPESIL